MPTLRGNELEKVIDLFERRGVHFHHACQLKDFNSYLALGGVPSRNLLERSGLPYTKFETDATDRAGGMWSMVFGNLTDFGVPFANFEWTRGPIPNPYGPILLAVCPSILQHASDVAICLRSAGARGFNRDAESLSTVNDVDRLFRHAIDAAPNDFAKAHIKFSEDLRREFSGTIPAAREAGTLNAEVSCIVDSEVLPLEERARVIVDQYVVNCVDLNERVQTAARIACTDIRIWPRRYKDGRVAILNQLGAAIVDGVTDPKVLVERDGLSDETREWAQLIVKNGLGWQFTRFANYLREGTLSGLLV